MEMRMPTIASGRRRRRRGGRPKGKKNFSKFSTKNRRKGKDARFARKDRPTNPTIELPRPSELPPLSPRPRRAPVAHLSPPPASKGEESDSDFVPEDSPSKNARSRKRTNDTNHGDTDVAADIDVDEEIYLDQLEHYYQGTSAPTDQLYRKLDKKGRIIFTKDEYRQRRMAIHYFFTTAYGNPDESTGLWDGRDGIAVWIRDSLLLPKTSSHLKMVKRMAA